MKIYRVSEFEKKKMVSVAIIDADRPAEAIERWGRLQKDYCLGIGSIRRVGEQTYEVRFVEGRRRGFGRWFGGAVLSKPYRLLVEVEHNDSKPKVYKKKNLVLRKARIRKVVKARKK